MKFKTTRKAIVESYSNIVCIGYCDAQHLLHFHSPVAYTCGTYGWNFDVYDIDGTAVCTGYRGMPGVHLPNVREYDRLAEKLLYAKESEIPYEEKKQQIEQLLEYFLNQKGA